MAYAKKVAPARDDDNVIDVEFSAATFDPSKPENFPIPAERFPITKTRCGELLGRSEGWIRNTATKALSGFYSEEELDRLIGNKITDRGFQAISFWQYWSQSQIPQRDEKGNVIVGDDEKPVYVASGHKASRKDLKAKFASLTGPEPQQTAIAGEFDNADDDFGKSYSSALTLNKERRLTSTEADEESQTNLSNMTDLLEQFEEILEASMSEKLEAAASRAMNKATGKASSKVIGNLGKFLQALED